MKKNLPLLVTALLLSSTLFAQQWFMNVPPEKRQQANFRDYQQAFYEYWSEHPVEKGQAHKQFLRLQTFLQTRIDEKGHFRGDKFYEAVRKQNIQRASRDNYYGDWTALGPVETPFWLDEGIISGSGRLDAIAFHPTDTNILFVGAHSGGLWKSVDGGQNWYTTTDHLPSIGISSIIIHPEHPDTIFISTGDRDTFIAYSIGVLKSTDGGESWEETGLIYQIDQNVVINKLIMDPNDPNTMMIATNGGIYKTSDASENWDYIRSGHFKDIHYKPGSSDTLYASTYSAYGGARMWRSTDAGESFQLLSNTGIPSSSVCRISIGLSPAQAEWVYAFCSRAYPSSTFYGLYRSQNGGDNWELLTSGDDINLLGRSLYGTDTEGYGWYTLQVAVDPQDANTIYTGGVNIWKSTDAGANWTILTHEQNGISPDVFNTWVDYHAFEFHPITGKFYAGHDGGLISTWDGGDNFEDLSDGLEILQIYRIGTSATDEDKALCGVQDQFAMYKSDNTWVCMRTGESGENFFDYTDPNTFYVTGYGGGMKRSDSGGYPLLNITPSGISWYMWLPPFIIDPNDPETIYVGFNDIYVSNTKGGSWSTLATGVSSNTLNYLEIAQSNTDFLIAGTPFSLQLTKDYGDSWTDIRATMNTSVQIADVCFSTEDENTIFASLGGFIDGEKIYKSMDAGETWENISLNLPNVPINTIVHESNANNGIYAGTDIGVFYINDNLNEWIDFSEGLPTVVVNELEIHYSSGKLRAGTYGRGLWESPLMDQTVDIKKINKDLKITVGPNPVSDFLNIKLNLQKEMTASYTLTNSAGQHLIQDITQLATGANHIELDCRTYPKGIYFLTIKTGDAIISKKIIK